MTDTVESDIAEAMLSVLDQSLISVPLPIKMPGVAFEVPQSMHLDASMHFSSVSQVTAGDSGRNRYTGFLRVSVNDLAGDGVLRALRMAAEIVSLYRRGSTLMAGGRVVRIISPPYVSDPLETSGWIRVPVTIRWQSDNANVS